jgi:hypothetical protein
LGLNRRAAESLNAQARFTPIAPRSTPAGCVAASAIQEASLREPIAAPPEFIGLNSNLPQLLRQQFAAGAATRLDAVAVILSETFLSVSFRWQP